MAFLLYLRARWPIVTVACGVAVVLTFVVSMVLPRQYTATAEILIDPPAGADPRAATVVSPAYLESLKVYERLAGSDTLFAKALDHVHPKGVHRDQPIESLRKRVLKVSKPVNTSLLEIAVTLRDSPSAQAMAQYIAEQTAELSRAAGEQPGREVEQALRARRDAARAQLIAAREAQISAGRQEPVEGLEAELRGENELETKLATDLAATRTELAGYSAERQSASPDDTEATDWLRGRIASAEARIAVLEKQEGELNARHAEKASRLGRWKDHRALLEADARAARDRFDSADERLENSLSEIQARGERLRVVDPGIVPQSPSSPDVLWNLIAALILSATGSLLYLAASFGYSRMSEREIERVYSLGR